MILIDHAPVNHHVVGPFKVRHNLSFLPSECGTRTSAPNVVVLLFCCKNTDHLHQGLGLRFKRLSRCCRLFHQRSILLGNLIHLLHRLVNLLNALRLILASAPDLVHDIRHATHVYDNFIHGTASFLDLRATTGDITHRFVNQPLDFACGFCTTPRQSTHLRSHHSKATALLPGTSCLHCRVQRQYIGLKGDTV